MIRLCDIVFSAIGLLLLSPLFLIVYVLIRCESKGGGFYCQQRVGKDGRMFDLYKFRSMRRDAQATLDKLLESNADLAMVKKRS